MSATGKSHRFHYEGGIVEFVEILEHEKAAVNQKPVFMRGEKDGMGRDRAAVERRVQRDDLLLRQQDQHGRRRHAPVGIPGGADPHDQQLRRRRTISQGPEGDASAARTSARG